jgi:hypothetical protein
MIYAIEMSSGGSIDKHQVPWSLVKKFKKYYGFTTDGQHLLTLIPRSRIFFFILPWRWRRYVPPKHRFMLYLHGAPSQKTTFFIHVDITVKTSNLIKIEWVQVFSKCCLAILYTFYVILLKVLLEALSFYLRNN